MTSPTTVLIVDDDPLVLIAISCLVRIGYPKSRILIAKDGREGLDLAQQNQPDLIITDLKMPEMNGAQMVQLLRREQNNSRIPIIGMSSHDPASTQVATFERLCNVFLAKPLSLAELRETMALLLQPEGSTLLT